MTDDEEGRPEITKDDVIGLREDTKGLASSIDRLAFKSELDDESRARVKGIKGGVIVALCVLLLAFVGWRNNTDQVNAIKDQRTTSRIGLCVAINDMRAKHNHFVETTIKERQALIDATNAGSGTPEQKKQAADFFGAQIASYTTDLTAITDCNDPAAVATLFTKPG